MERLAELIGKLKEQFEQNADHRQLLVITRMIEQELMRQQATSNNRPVASKIAVVMPAARNSQPAQTQYSQASQQVNAAQVSDKPKAQASSSEIEKYANPAKEEVAPEPIPHSKFNAATSRQANSSSKEQPAKPAAAAKEQPSSKASEPSNGWNYDPLQDIPTLAQQEFPKEINDTISAQKPSRNDQLKNEVLEVAHRLTDSPIRDLKKGIGVNDRYVFINELFRGDEVMYERSIKTINNFRIYAEAQYWIERELKVKLGWDDTRNSVRHFYQLVKRRFL